jgi:hypothetical protein
MEHSQTHQEPTDKAERFFSVFRTHFVALSRHDSTKCVDITTEKTKSNNFELNSRSISTPESTPWSPAKWRLSYGQQSPESNSPKRYDQNSITSILLLANPTYAWEMQIGHVIPRDLQFTSTGDACLTGGGAFCHELQYWFDIAWSANTKNAIEKGSIHINMMEFIIVILQLAATIAIVEEHPQNTQISKKFYPGIPKLAKLLIQTDNSPSQNWAHKVSSKSRKRPTTGAHVCSTTEPNITSSSK